MIETKTTCHKWNLGETQCSAVLCVADSPEHLENVIDIFGNQAYPCKTSENHMIMYLGQLRGPAGKAKFTYCRHYKQAIFIAMSVDDILRPPSGIFLPELIGNADAIVVSGRLSDYVVRGYLSKSTNMNETKEISWNSEYPAALLLHQYHQSAP